MVEIIEAVIEYARALGLQYGILFLGWILAVFLLWRFVSNRDATEVALTLARNSHSEELRQARENFERRLEETSDQLSDDLKAAHTQIQALHQHHLSMISSITDKRISDMRDVVEDYNSMAESTMAALDKLSEAISQKKTSKR
jgi:hypothetical protein